MRTAIRFVLIITILTGLTNLGLARGREAQVVAGQSLILRNLGEQTLIDEALFQFGMPSKAQIKVDSDRRRIVLSNGLPESNKALVEELADLYFQKTGQRAITTNLHYENPIDLTEVLTALSGNVPLFSNYLVSGVNCHGTSLVATGLLNQVSHVDSGELDFVLEHDCRAVPVWQKRANQTIEYKPRPRLLGVRGRGTLFSHSFYVISKHVVLQKRSLEANKNFTFHVVDELPNATYYVCQKTKETCEDNVYLSMKSRTEIVDKFFLEFMTSYADPERRDEMLFEVHGLLGATTVLPNNQQCAADVERMRQRLLSLEVIGEQLKGSGAYVNLRSNDKIKY